MADVNATLTLYNNKSMQNVVHKNKTVITTLTGLIKENANLERLVVTVPYFAEFAQVNYARVDLFGRYYFVNVEVLTGDLIRLTMTSDAISSFWDSYKNSNVIARRSSSHPDVRIDDNRILKLPEPQIIFRKTNCALTLANTNNYVLTLTGK